MNVISLIDSRIAQAMRGLSQIVRRAKLELVESDLFCQAQAGTNELFNRVELWQHYGFASRPVVGTLALLLKLGGVGDGAVALATTHRDHRPGDLLSGDSCLYGAKVGAAQALVIARAAGNVDVACADAGTINLGGSQESILLGDQVVTDIRAFADIVKAIIPGDPAANALALTAIKGAAETLSSAAAAWPSQHGRVA